MNGPFAGCSPDGIRLKGLNGEEEKPNREEKKPNREEKGLNGEEEKPNREEEY